MVICHEKKCIFIHIPKTGGTSIEQFIKDNGKNNLLLIGCINNRSLQHLTINELRIMIPYFYKIYYKFSVVRDPYERLLSEYYWNPSNIGYKNGKSKRDFLNKVTEIVQKEKYFNNVYNDHFIPQYNFLFYKNKLLVDQLFKYEDLEVVSKFLKKKFKIERNFPYLNRNKFEKESWNHEDKEIIYNLYKNDFLYFDYKK
jgi:hypothetical protein